MPFNNCLAQERLRLTPDALGNDGGRFRPCQRGGLPGGQAPAIGARRIGTRIPNRSQKPAARLRGSSMSTPSSRFQFEIHLCPYLHFCLLTLNSDYPCSRRVWANVLPYG